MNKIGDNKRKQINDIVSVVKLSSLFFTAIVFFQYIFKEGNFVTTSINDQYNLNAIGIVAFLLVSIYFIWAFSINNKVNEKNIKMIQLIENIVFIIVFLIAIIISGAHTSQYKFLFLFLITTTTIQSGIGSGMAIAGISSVLILLLDIVCIPNIAVNSYFENDLILAGVFILTAWPLGFYVKIEGEHIKELEGLVNKDGLTGVYNHRYFHEALREKITISKERNTSVSLIFIDIDYFKHYNDLYGHQKGDDVLKEIGAILEEVARDGDIVARYGGEEFAVILPNTTEVEATVVAEEIRNKIELTYFYGQENQPNENVTASIGISVYPEKASDDITLIKSADDALYRAKFFNKNRVETYTSILDDLKNDIDAKDVELVASIKTLISVINAKDRYTYGHCERLVLYSRLLAEKMQLSEDDKRSLVYGAYMHDIGKINIAKEILIKKMPLTNEEWEILKNHPENGVEIIKPVKSLENIAPLILHHHEKYNGQGYPYNLKGEEIPYLARVLTVIDSFDAMTSNRPYNKRKTYTEAIDEIKKYKGIQFDPEIADIFIEVIMENKDKLDSLS
ncbi:HD-GYP domain-containing protein [Clostridium sp.]|uniref:HD-GYP domain-containing protein n=1 Tax=Clostridium sp. TaxID=1506 RepID=UPI003F341648